MSTGNKYCDEYIVCEACLCDRTEAINATSDVGQLGE